MSQRVWSLALVVGALLVPGAASPQGFVQERGPRRAVTLEPSELCETWRGDIHGNDPSAVIVVELCTRGTHVRGSFFWSSAASGWDRRALEGEWRDGGSTLEARDTAMLESHPQHGWTLCAADAYSLRRVSADRLEGTYASDRCRDHGRLGMTRSVAAPVPAAKRVAPPPVTHAPSPAARHGAARCSATPGLATPASPALAATCALALLAMRRRRR